MVALRNAHEGTEKFYIGELTPKRRLMGGPGWLRRKDPSRRGAGDVFVAHQRVMFLYIYMCWSCCADDEPMSLMAYINLPVHCRHVIAFDLCSLLA